MLRQEAAVRPHEGVVAGAFAQLGDDRGDGMHDVVVPRPAGEAQSAGAGELRFDVESERRGAEADGRREARVQVDDGDVVDPDAGQLEGPTPTDADGRRVRE